MKVTGFDVAAVMAPKFVLKVNGSAPAVVASVPHERTPDADAFTSQDALFKLETISCDVEAVPETARFVVVAFVPVAFTNVKLRNVDEPLSNKLLKLVTPRCEMDKKTFDIDDDATSNTGFVCVAFPCTESVAHGVVDAIPTFVEVARMPPIPSDWL